MPSAIRAVAGRSRGIRSRKLTRAERKILDRPIDPIEMNRRMRIINKQMNKGMLIISSFLIIIIIAYHSLSVSSKLEEQNKTLDTYIMDNTDKIVLAILIILFCSILLTLYSMYREK